MLAAIVGVASPEVHRLAQRVGQADRDRERRALVADVVEEDGELVAAETGGGVGRPERRSHAPARRDQDVVAAGVAQRVVEDLEVVEVDEQDRERPAVPAVAALEGLDDAVAEQDPVREPVRPSCSAWWRISS
jgi:hypothetical protein